MLSQGPEMDPDSIYFLDGLATADEIPVCVAKPSVEVEDRFPILQSACHEDVHGMLPVVHVIGICKHRPEADQSSKAIFGSTVQDHFLELCS